MTSAKYITVLARNMVIGHESEMAMIITQLCDELEASETRALRVEAELHKLLKLMGQ